MVAQVEHTVARVQVVQVAVEADRQAVL